MVGGPPKFPLDPGEDINLDALADKADLRAYDPAEDREEARRRLAYGLLGLLILVVAALLGGDFSGLISIEETKDLALAILSPVVVLVGTALGFYFGGQES
jgi:hypothetical protein